MGLFKRLLGIPEWIPAKTVDRDRFAGDGITMTPKPNNSARWFKQDKQTFSEKLKPGQSVVIKWDYDQLKLEQIEELYPHCKCTANLYKGTKGISAEFTHQEKDVPAGGQEYTKYLTVYYKDGKGKVRNEAGVLVWPPDKLQRALSFTGWLMP